MHHDLRVRSLRVDYAGAVALDVTDLDFPAGCVTGLIGPNGAGKTSLLDGLYGTVGTAKLRLGTEDISSWSPMRRRTGGIGIVPQGRQLFPTLSVADNLAVMGSLLGTDQSEQDRVMEMFPILKERAKQLAGVLSGGEQQMLAMGRALMGSPSVLLLDEMNTGLAPKIVRQLNEEVTRLAEEGTTVVVEIGRAHV